MSDVVDVTVEPFDLPLAEPFEISLGTRASAANLLVTVETAAGTVGYGEGSPIEPVTGETQAGAIATAEAAGELLVGEPVAGYRRLVESVRSTFPGAAAATFAVETALLDAYCRERGLPLSELFGGRPTPVESDLTVPIVPPEEAARRAREATAAGFERLKIKTGTDLEADLARVRAVADAAPDAELTVDANQGWTPKATARFVDRLEADGIALELVEQPVPATDIEGLVRTRERVPVPVAADEAVFTPADAVRVVRAGAADVLNVKLGKSGVLGAAAIAAIARGADLGLMVGCMLESAVGIHTSAHVVAGLGGFGHVDLDGNRLLATDVADTGEGPVHDIAGPGHGIVPEHPG